MSEPGCPPQNDHPNPMPQPEGPAPAPPAELQPVNQPAPVQLVMNLTGPSNPAPHHGHPYAGYPVQNYLPNPIPQPGQYIAACPTGVSSLPNILPEGPAPAPQPAGIQLVNQPAPVQPVMNPAPHQDQAYTDPAPQPGGIQLVNQPAPVQPVTAPHNGQPAGPAPAPPAELQPVNHPAPGQLVMDPPGPSNPAPHEIQPYAAPAVPPLAIPFGVPPGLEYLIQIDQILIHQKVSCIEMFTDFETNNQYKIRNSIGQEIYLAKEKSDCCTRNIFGSAHSFQMQIKNNVGQEVIRMNRPMRCFLQEIEVQAPLGVTIGYVKQEWSCFLPKFSILGPNNEVLLKIQGPFLPLKCCGDINFEVKGMNGGNSIGQIIKQ
ncbi:hypothetical protein R3I93_000745 [Phoxinus phoxinus]|uniref:Phospholipid scramblase n=2 Tax=Phoxinus phoxinus TaxID=58324 RepID=A0AAN9DSN6_9TELE